MKLPILKGVISQAPPDFETLALSTNPFAYYNFQQSWASGLQDQSGNGRHIAAASGGPWTGAAVRSTTTQTAAWSTAAYGFPFTKSGLGYKFYDLNGAVLNNMFFDPVDSNKTKMTLTWSFSEYTAISGNFIKYIGWRDGNSIERMSCYTQYPSGTSGSFQMQRAINHTTSLSQTYLGGFGTRTDAWRIFTLRFNGDTGEAKAFVNGVQVGTTVDATYNSLYAPAPTTSPFEFMGDFTGGGTTAFGQTDACLMNREVLGDATIIALHEAYLAELL